MNKDNSHTCGNCARLRGTDGYCMKKATYVNALGEAPECFEAAAEPTIVNQDKQEPRTKLCELCGRELPLDAFSWHKSGRRKKICKECQSRRIKAGNDRSDKVQRKRSEITSKADAPQENTDAEMVTLLRSRGWTVTCTRTITEEL